jgi:hypothetical protein
LVDGERTAEGSGEEGKEHGGRSGFVSDSEGRFRYQLLIGRCGFFKED